MIPLPDNSPNSSVPNDVPSIAGVVFRRLGKMHYYAANGDRPLELGDFVVAETERGIEYGEVKILRTVAGSPNEIPQEYRILRIATDDDKGKAAQQQSAAQNALTDSQRCADELGLSIKFIEAEISFDAQTATFYFVSENRIDFRQLVRDIAAILHVRILLQQVGTRDHAKLLGGYGPCGRPLCCTTFLRDFAPVSMRMARDQSLYLNPTKFSGVCGKLMCCLRYEHDIYTEARERMPAVGMFVQCPDGSRGEIIETDIFKETVTVLIRGEEMRRTKYKAELVTAARSCGDCGTAGGGCGDSCASCGSGKPKESELLSLTVRRR